MKLIDNIYHYIWSGQDNNCNSYLLANLLKDGGHVLVDPGHVQTPQSKEPALNQLLSLIQADGLDPRKIGMVLLTHFHPDHCEGAIALQREWDCLVGIHETEAEFFAQYGGVTDLFLQEGNLEFSNETTMDLQIYHSPGHSPGHVTIYDPALKVLIAGDLIFYRSTGRADLPGGSSEQMKQSIKRLAELDIEYLLCGHPYGHPGVLKGKKEIQENFDTIKAMF